MISDDTTNSNTTTLLSIEYAMLAQWWSVRLIGFDFRSQQFLGDLFCNYFTTVYCTTTATTTTTTTTTTNLVVVVVVVVVVVLLLLLLT